jgi:hypothetical protein
LLAALLLAGIGACKPKPKPLSVARIIIDAPRRFDGKGGLRDLLRRQVRQVLDEDRSVKLVRRRAEATHLLQIVLGYVPASIGPAVPAHMAERRGEVPAQVPGVDVEVEVRLRPTADGLAFSAVSTAGDGSSVDMLAAAFGRAWQIVERQRALEAAGTDALVAALQDPNGKIRDFAIQRLGELHVVAAVEPLCDVLRAEEDQRIVLRTVGALVAIGDVRAVEPLIDITRRKDAAFVRQVVFAVGSIGGRTAEAFLVTLAEGHPAVEVQQAAKDALQEMNRRAVR